MSRYIQNVNINTVEQVRIVNCMKNMSRYIQHVMMYSARCRQPWGTSRTDRDDDQDLAKLRRKKESHRG